MQYFRIVFLHACLLSLFPGSVIGEAGAHDLPLPVFEDAIQDAGFVGRVVIRKRTDVLDNGVVCGFLYEMEPREAFKRVETGESNITVFTGLDLQFSDFSKEYFVIADQADAGGPRTFRMESERMDAESVAPGGPLCAPETTDYMVLSGQQGVMPIRKIADRKGMWVTADEGTPNLLSSAPSVVTVLTVENKRYLLNYRWIDVKKAVMAIIKDKNGK